MIILIRNKKEKMLQTLCFCLQSNLNKILFASIYYILNLENE